MFRSSIEFEIFCNMSVLHLLMFSDWFRNLFVRSVPSISIQDAREWFTWRFFKIYLNIYEFSLRDLICNRVIPSRVSGHRPGCTILSPFSLAVREGVSFHTSYLNCLTMCHIKFTKYWNKYFFVAFLFDWNFCTEQSRIFSPNRVKLHFWKSVSYNYLKRWKYSFWNLKLVHVCNMCSRITKYEYL